MEWYSNGILQWNDVVDIYINCCTDNLNETVFRMNGTFKDMIADIDYCFVGFTWGLHNVHGYTDENMLHMLRVYGTTKI